MAFFGKIQIAFFLRRQQRDHRIYSGPAPTSQLIFEPVAAARPGSHCELSRPGTIHPI